MNIDNKDRDNTDVCSDSKIYYYSVSGSSETAKQTKKSKRKKAAALAILIVISMFISSRPFSRALPLCSQEKRSFLWSLQEKEALYCLN